MINYDLARKRNLSDETILEIEELYLDREDWLKELKFGSQYVNLKEVNSTLDNIELRLQSLWGFDLNPNYIKFWNRPRCTCPKTDNNERFPHGYYITNGDCPLHGN